VYHIQKSLPFPATDFDYHDGGNAALIRSGSKKQFYLVISPLSPFAIVGNASDEMPGETS